MITIRAGKAAITVCLLVLAGCSREQQDWRSAEAADSIEAYDQFIQRHPESELANQARTRVVQLGEDRDWQHAGSADTVEAYREFITQHPNGKWAQEARIRIENFSLGEQRAGSGNVAGAGSAPNGGPGTQGASSARHRDGGLAVPGEAAVPMARTSTSAGSAHTGSGSSAAAAAAAAGQAAAPSATSATGPAMSARAAASTGGGVPAGESVAAAGPATAAKLAAAVGTATPAAAAATTPIHSGAYGVQLGAFGSESAANTEWHLLTGRFGPELQGLSEHVVMAETASGRIYRLQAVVGEESRARAICDSLRKSSQACVAVLPH